MCSRYNLTSPPEAVRAYFGYADTPNFPARYNIAPTQPIAVVARDREGTQRFRLMRWGLLPSFVKDPKQFPTLINARSDYVLVKGAMKKDKYKRKSHEVKEQQAKNPMKASKAAAGAKK